MPRRVSHRTANHGDWGRLVDADRSVLIIVDVQEYFVRKLDERDAGPVVGRVVWLAAVATWLDIPIIVTAEDPERRGGTVSEISKELPVGTHVYDKPVFGIAANPEILGAVANTGRNTLVLVGLETDVCVSQSAMGLLDSGFRVIAVSDATASPGDAHTHGIERMREAGVEIVTTKLLFYEWTRSAEKAARFRAERADLGAPPGVVF